LTAEHRIRFLSEVGNPPGDEKIYLNYNNPGTAPDPVHRTPVGRK
jgi:hypothetical protein